LKFSSTAYGEIAGLSHCGFLKLTGKNLTGQKLLKVDLDLQPMDKCVDVISEQVDLQVLHKELGAGLPEDSMLCAGVLEGGKDSCQVRPHAKAFASTVVPDFRSLYRSTTKKISFLHMYEDRLWGLVVRVPGYRPRRPGFDFRRYQIF
jgi:hypothetical protein